MWRLRRQSEDRAGDTARQPSDRDVALLEGQCAALAEIAEDLAGRLGRLLGDAPGSGGQADGSVDESNADPGRDGGLDAELQRFVDGLRDRSIADLSERKRRKRFAFIDEAVAGRLEYLSQLHDEFRRVISLLSESLVALSTANVDYHAELREKLDHLVEASRLDDLRSLKSTLEREIESTRDLVRRKRRSEERSIDELASEVSSLNEELTRAREESKRDELTGVGNRRALNAYLEDLVEAQGGRGSLGSLLILDVDNFKSINDRHGHSVGDRALLGLTTIVSSEIRGDDLIARLGGDEFVVVLPRAALRNALRVAEDIRVAVEATRFTLDDDHGDDSLAMTVSVGVAQHAAGETVSELMRRADQGLYEAKSRGKNAIGGTAGD